MLNSNDHQHPVKHENFYEEVMKEIKEYEKTHPNKKEVVFQSEYW